MENSVLVVDDDAVCRGLVCEVLKKEGYKPLCAGSGVEALHIMEDSRPAAILMDIRMPGISGIDVFKNIKTIDSTIPIIFWTGWLNIEETVGLMKLGAWDCISKPAEIGHLITTIDAAIAYRKGHKPLDITIVQEPLSDEEMLNNRCQGIRRIGPRGSGRDT